jgi:hypothetical protein
MKDNIILGDNIVKDTIDAAISCSAMTDEVNYLP